MKSLLEKIWNVILILLVLICRAPLKTRESCEDMI